MPPSQPTLVPKVERRGQAGTDESVRRAGVEQDDDVPRALRRRGEARQVRLERRVVPPPGRKLGCA